VTLLDDRNELNGPPDTRWTAACRYDYLIPCRGVGVLLPDGAQAALFRLDDGSLHAIGNIDPFSGAAVMSRGITGDRGGRAIVQSPIKKQAFAFDDGSCLDDPSVSLPVYRTRRTADGVVEIEAPVEG
jgi:nitrite reductase (NADH) small subunit